MTDRLRQIAIIVTVLVTLAVNFLAVALPLNGLNTGAISDQFKVYFVPAGYVFSIWGIIYIGLIAYAIFQALTSQRENPRLRAAGWWMAASGIANSAWLFAWHYEQFVWTLLIMLALLVTLIGAYLNLGIGKTVVAQTERWMVHIPVSSYLGWITVATAANATDLLDFLHWSGFGVAPKVWAVILIGVVFLISAAMSFTRRDIAYSAVLVWALIGVGVHNASIRLVAFPAYAAAAAIVLVLAWLVSKPWLARR
jgi:benzodiazapine receptor